ncbi:MAG: DUF4652 domain-containing protein [Candidatus Pristimantibacillus sp.]
MDKKQLAWVLSTIVFLVFMMGCSEAGVTAVKVEEPLIMGKNVIYPESGPPSILIVQSNNEIEISDIEQYPSLPIISPDQSKLAYISPFEFEMSGEVWLYETGSDKPINKITQDQFRDNKSPNRIYWLDDNHLLVLSGNTYGTIPSNHHLDIYDLAADKINPFVEVPNNQSIRSVTLRDGKAVLDIETYDDNFINATKETVTYDIPKLD